MPTETVIPRKNLSPQRDLNTRPADYESAHRHPSDNSGGLLPRQVSSVHVSSPTTSPRSLNRALGLPTGAKREDVRSLRRFYAKVRIDPDTGCHIWEGAIGRNGYGVFWFEGRPVLAHRWKYELERGPIPAGLLLDHREACPRNCVNESHVTPATPRENTARGRSVVGARIRAIDARRVA